MERALDVGGQGKKRRRVCCASGEELWTAIESALTERKHVVMVRVSGDLLQQIDMLAEAGICRSRSSAATFMIREGVKANRALFERVAGTTRKIVALKEDLRNLVGEGGGDEASA